MRRRRTFVVWWLAFVMVVTAACDWGDAGAPPSPPAAPKPPPVVASPPAPTSIPATPVSVATPSAPRPIVVHEPQPGARVASPLTLSGLAIAPEGTVRFELVAADGAVLAQGFATASEGAPSVGAFSADLLFPGPAEDGEGRLRVFFEDPRTGATAGLVEVR